MIELDDGVSIRTRFYKGGEGLLGFSDKLSYMKIGKLHGWFNGSDEKVYFKCDGFKYFKEIDKTCKTANDIRDYIRRNNE